MYYNDKRYYCILLEAFADALYRFTAIDVGAYGKQSDGGIFRQISLYQLLNSNGFNKPPAKKLPLSDVELPFVNLGDEAYPLLSCLMRSYPRRQLNESRRQFIYRLSRERRVVGSAFGIRAGKWRICRSQWPSGLRLVSTADGLLGLQVRMPPGAWMVFRCECCVLSGRGLCDGLIIRPEESYRLWCVLVCDLGTSRMRRLKLIKGCKCQIEEYYTSLSKHLLIWRTRL